MQQRAWATHEEIAAIGDARADRLEKEIAEDPWALESDTKAKQARADVIRQNAENMRYAGRMKMAGR